MYRKLSKWAYKIESNLIFSSIRKGFVLIIPIVITGSFALLIQNFPILPFQNWLQSFCGGMLHQLLGSIFDATVGFISAYVLLSISYYYASALSEKTPALQIVAMFTALSCFVASFGGSVSLTVASFGTVGVFTAILCAILATKLFFFLSRCFFHRLHTYSAGSDLQYRSATGAILPMFLCILIFAGANVLLKLILGVNNFNDLISNGLVLLFDNIHYELSNGIAFTAILNLLWVFGIHGGNALDVVGQQIFSSAADQSMILSKSFFDNFVVLGGSGATLCLVLALLLASRTKSNRRLAYFASPMALFNINEILVYGLPIVLNPFMALPFILVPLCSLLLTYTAVFTGLMPPVTEAVTWTTPVFFSGYLATGSLRGSFVQLVIVLMGTGIYLPFIRLSERLQDERASMILSQLTDHFRSCENSGLCPAYLTRHDEFGILAKSMVSQLHRDIQENQIPLFYQPQVDASRITVGAEALLRWKFNGNPVYPPLLIALAKEDGCFDLLTLNILKTACRDEVFLHQTLSPNFEVSVNVAAEQINDPAFVRQIAAICLDYGINHHLILEITEESSLSQLKQVPENIAFLRKNGIHMAIDDFSMGQTSLTYLKDNNFSYVKLDGSLVRQLLENDRCREIISSIITLGGTLGFEVVAEYVENETLYDILQNLGCQFFQGYLFSPALPLKDFLSYCKQSITSNV